MTKLRKMTMIPCPCGCKRFIIEPFFNCQCSSLSKEDAEYVVAIFNLGLERAVEDVKRDYAEDDPPTIF